MIDTKNMITDEELDMITGGNGTAFILPGKIDGLILLSNVKQLVMLIK